MSADLRFKSQIEGNPSILKAKTRFWRISTDIADLEFWWTRNGVPSSPFVFACLANNTKACQSHVTRSVSAWRSVPGCALQILAQSLRRFVKTHMSR